MQSQSNRITNKSKHSNNFEMKNVICREENKTKCTRRWNCTIKITFSFKCGRLSLKQKYDQDGQKHTNYRLKKIRKISFSVKTPFWNTTIVGEGVIERIILDFIIPTECG